MTLTAWHNSPDLKTVTVAALRKDHELDHLVRGTYGEMNGSYRGCQIGCLVMADMSRKGTLTKDAVYGMSGWHAEVETRFGVPRQLAYLWDRCFENVAYTAAPDFAVASVEAVPVGADLSLVVSRLMLDILADPERGVWKYAKEETAARGSVERVAELYRRRLSGDEPTRDEWVTARAAADAAAADAAYAAAYAAYADAADAYAAAYADAAADAAYAAAYADADAAADAAYAAAWQGHWAWIGERIIHHTLNAPISAVAA